MAGGDSSAMAVVAKEKGADEPLWKKQKQEEPQLAEEEEEPEPEPEQGVNPLDPRYSEYDPKQGGFVYTRYFNRRRPNLDQESPFGPMRHTDKNFGEDFYLTSSANVVSVKIVQSDYGYPLNVYGTIIARDSIDQKCIYLFRRGKDDCQLITSKDDSFILTGPNRGFKVCGAIIFEINLWVKDADGRKVKDERLSKGVIEVDGVLWLSYAAIHKVEMETLASMHSVLDLSYTLVKNAVEGTVEVRILEGPADFHGKICATTTTIPSCCIALHDSRVNGVLTAGDNGVVQTAWRVVGVSVDEMLLLTVAAAMGGDEFSERTVEFTPRRYKYDEEEIWCGNYKMLVKVTWSVLL